MTQLTASILKTASSTSATCECADPIPVQRAARKGAAVTICQRCGLRVPLRLR
ncbi:MAG: hypothetical protein JOY72_03720 [Actinobacteria bacterium]|nr:hypothetical protein [Actinomycetota bacterium]MBV8479390.1 hypothetical protein [Actinomycetota bacterium]